MPRLPAFITTSLRARRVRRHSIWKAALCLAIPVGYRPISGQARIVLNGGNTVSTLAGTGSDGVTSPGAALAAVLGHPRAVLYDSAGNLYVADSRNHQVSRIASDGTLTIIAGTGTEGFSGDGGPGTAAQLSHPSALAIRADGTLLICDTGNHRVRSISSSGIITTLAGTGTPGNSGDGGPATAAALRRPSGVALDSGGNVLVADTGNHRVRRISPAGIIDAFAGTGDEGDSGDGGPAKAATFQTPSALLSLPDGRILVGDPAAKRIRTLQSDGTVAAYIMGTSLRRPLGLSIITAGDVLVSDADLQQLMQVSSAASGSLAGSGQQGPFTTGVAQVASFNSPDASATAGDGSIAVADRQNHQVQRIALPAMNFGSVPAGNRSTSQPLTLFNGGAASLQVISVSLPSAFVADNAGTCSAFPVRLQAGESCTVTLRFQPVAQGAASGIATVVTDAAPSASLRLTGTALPPATLAASKTSLVINGSIAYVGAPIQLTASVNGSLSSPPAGNVTFVDGTSPLSTLALASSTATYATAALTPGNHTLQASYSGDDHYATSASAPLTIAVVPQPDFTLSASAASYSAGTSATVTVPLSCAPQNGTLNRSVTFGLSGLPTGFTATFAPPLVALAGNPVSSSLTITVPATVAANATHSRIVMAGVLLLLPFAASRSRRKAALMIVTLSLTLNGCGGGFRTTATSSISVPHRYNLTVTASTTGVLGDTLVHSIPIELVITP